MQFIFAIYFSICLILLSYGSSSSTEAKVPERKNRLVPKSAMEGHYYLFGEEDDMQPFDLEFGKKAAQQQPLKDQDKSNLLISESSNFSIKEFFAFLLALSVIILLLMSHIGRIVLAVDFLLIFACFCYFKIQQRD